MDKGDFFERGVFSVFGKLLSDGISVLSPGNFIDTYIEAMIEEEYFYGLAKTKPDFLFDSSPIIRDKISYFPVKMKSGEERLFQSDQLSDLARNHETVGVLLSSNHARTRLFTCRPEMDVEAAILADKEMADIENSTYNFEFCGSRENYDQYLFSIFSESMRESFEKDFPYMFGTGIQFVRVLDRTIALTRFLQHTHRWDMQAKQTYLCVEHRNDNYLLLWNVVCLGDGFMVPVNFYRPNIPVIDAEGQIRTNFKTMRSSLVKNLKFEAPSIGYIITDGSRISGGLMQMMKFAEICSSALRVEDPNNIVVIEDQFASLRGLSLLERA